MNLEDETRQQIIDLLETIETYRSEKGDLEAKLAAHQRVADSFAEGADGILRLVTEIIEQRKLKAQLASANEAICGIRETLTVLAGLPDSKGFTHVAELHDTIKMAEFAKQALSSSPVCLHKEKAERLKKDNQWFKEKTEACVAEHIAVAKQLAALQSALDEERGRTMEWEFRAQHQTVYHPGRGHKICSGCDGDTLKNERHNWSRQQWTEAAKRRS